MGSEMCIRDSLNHMVKQDTSPNSEVADMVEPDFAIVDLETPVASLSGLFNTASILIAMNGGKVEDVITKIDLIDFMAKKLN